MRQVEMIALLQWRRFIGHRNHGVTNLQYLQLPLILPVGAAARGVGRGMKNRNKKYMEHNV